MHLNAVLRILVWSKTGKWPASSPASDSEPSLREQLQAAQRRIHDLDELETIASRNLGKVEKERDGLRRVASKAVGDAAAWEAENRGLREQMACADTPLMRDVLAERDGLKEQYQTLRQSLDEVHEVQCGCDEPGRSDLCVAQPPTSFRALADPRCPVKGCDLDHAAAAKEPQ